MISLSDIGIVMIIIIIVGAIISFINNKNN